VNIQRGLYMRSRYLLPYLGLLCQTERGLTVIEAALGRALTVTVTEAATMYTCTRNISERFMTVSRICRSSYDDLSVG